MSRFTPHGYTEEEWATELAQVSAEVEARKEEQYRLERERQAADDAAAAERSARRAAAKDRRREQAQFEVPFLPTSVAQIVMSTIATSLRYGENSLIIGAAGVGKTRALREIRRQASNGELDYEVAYVNVTTVIGTSLKETYRALGEAVDVDYVDEVGGMRRKLVRKASRFPVLLFDEAQNLGLRQLRELLELSQEIGLQMVFAGNGEVLKLVNSGRGAISQISRRLPFREEIRCILDDDADLIANHFGVEGMDAFRLCREIGGRFHADGVAKVLMIARDRFGEAGPIGVPAIRDALGLMPHIAQSLAADSRPRRVQRQTTLGPA